MAFDWKYQGEKKTAIKVFKNTEWRESVNTIIFVYETLRRNMEKKKKRDKTNKLKLVSW